MGQELSPRRNFTLRLSFENLEGRIVLDGGGVVDDQEACLLELSGQDDAARATRAINCFAIDLYQHLQHEQGNLFLSPISIATGLTMAYAGASGETASQMANVLHLDSDADIYASFRALLASLDKPTGLADGFELELANALWPDIDVTVRDEFIQTIETDYGGKSQRLDYSNPDQAKDVINSWVEEKTRGKVKDLIDRLGPRTKIVLTNSIYFNALWTSPFQPASNHIERSERLFYREDGEPIDVSMMISQPEASYTEIDGFQVLDIPFQGDAASMVFVLPQERNGTNELTPEVLVEIDQWLKSPRDSVHFLGGVVIPKFQSSISTKLKELLSDMGMPLAFGAGADFSSMTDTSVWIDRVRHKAFLEVDELGTEAGASTETSLGACFTAGTPVLTPDGEKPIEQLKAGDYVLSRDEKDVERGLKKKVVEATRKGHSNVVRLQVGGRSIRTTDAHPFFVMGQGWTAAGKLRDGDSLATNTGDWKKVESISEPQEAEPVYNLRVADYHTYFVGSQSWGFAIWTHNWYDKSFRADHPFHFLIRDNATSTVLFMGRVNDPTQSENELNPTVHHVPGDSNVDGQFNQLDIVAVLQTGKYLTGEAATYEEGDWSGDGVFNQVDIVGILTTGTYLQAAVAAVDAAFATD